MTRKYFTDPYILLLLAGNIYCIWYYNNHPDAFATVVWIYWFQSITIGFFTFLDLLTVRRFDAAGFTINDKPVTALNKGCAAWFFLFHYGFFHLAYCIFLLIDFDLMSVDRRIVLIGVAAFFMESVLNFIKQKQTERTGNVQIGILFTLPYLRIIPMHLMIILPVFLGWKPSLLFLTLKTGADLLSYLYARNRIAKKRIESAV